MTGADIVSKIDDPLGSISGLVVDTAVKIITSRTELAMAENELAFKWVMGDHPSYDNDGTFAKKAFNTFLDIWKSHVNMNEKMWKEFGKFYKKNNRCPSADEKVGEYSSAGGITGQTLTLGTLSGEADYPFGREFKKISEYYVSAPSAVKTKLASSWTKFRDRLKDLYDGAAIQNVPQINECLRAANKGTINLPFQ